MPTRADLKAIVAPVLRGTALGSALGILPGGGAMLSAFAAYTVEKRISKTPQRFGKGAIEGVAAPEAANNAGAQTSFIPMLTLGIPANPVMALMIGALTIKNIVPGPDVATEQPALFWGVIASMWIGNLMLVLLNLPLVGLWVKLLTIPYYLLFPAILAFCCNRRLQHQQQCLRSLRRSCVRPSRLHVDQNSAASRLRCFSVSCWGR